MKPILILPVLAANAVAADLTAPPANVPADTPIQIRIHDPAPPALAAAVSVDVKDEYRGKLSGQNAVGTGVTVDVKDGKSTITITVEKDGKRETKTLVLPQNTPLDAVTEKIAQELQSAGAAAPAPAPENKVTYLGVMLDEPPTFLYGAGAGGMAPGFGLGPGAGTGGGSAGAAAHPGLPPGTGLSVSGITPGSPAESAGLKPGDILAKLNDQILVNPGQFTTLIRNMKEGENVTLTYLRDGQEARSQATLASRIESPVAGGGLGGAGFAADLARVLTLDPEGNVIEARPGAPVPPVPPLPGTPPAPPSPPDIKPLLDDRPAWENALREAAAAKDKAAAHWHEQLSKWRAEWTESQQNATDEYRRAVEKMSQEVAKAREAADKAREEARRAIEEAMRKLEEKRTKDTPKPDSPETGPADSDEPAEPKKA